MGKLYIEPLFGGEQPVEEVVVEEAPQPIPEVLPSRVGLVPSELYQALVESLGESATEYGPTLERIEKAIEEGHTTEALELLDLLEDLLEIS